MNDYRKKLGEIWPDLTTFLDRNKVKNFSIWNAEDLIFGYYENEDGAKLSALLWPAAQNLPAFLFPVPAAKSAVRAPVVLPPAAF